MRISTALSAPVLAFFLLVLAAAARAEDFVISTGEWPPYVSRDLPGGGPLARIVSEALEAAGDTASFQFLPWRRQELELKGGKALASFPWALNESLQATLAYSEPLCSQRMVFFFLKSRLPGWDYTGLDGLKKFRLGGALGYSYQEDFEKAGITADYAPDSEKSIRKLLDGRVDLVVENELVGRHLMESKFPAYRDAVASSTTPLYVKPLRLVVSRSHPGADKLLEDFAKGMDILKQSGRYAQILKEGGL